MHQGSLEYSSDSSSADEDIFDDSSSKEDDSQTSSLEDGDSETTDRDSPKQKLPDQPIRKSTRVRRPPEWVRSGQYITKRLTRTRRGEKKPVKKKPHKQNAGEAEDVIASSGLSLGVNWQQKADFLAKLAMDDAFQRIPAGFCQAILTIVSKE